MNSSDKISDGARTIKFLYSYSGKIVPRPIDGKLRYTGGLTRVLSVDRSISFAELMIKFGELCGDSMKLKCKLPNKDLDLLVSITCDDDLRDVISVYERLSPESKITAVLFPNKSSKKVSPPSSPMSCFDFPSAPLKTAPAPSFALPFMYQRFSPVVGYPATAWKYYCSKSEDPRCVCHAPNWRHSHSGH